MLLQFNQLFDFYPILINNDIHNKKKYEIWNLLLLIITMVERRRQKEGEEEGNREAPFIL